MRIIESELDACLCLLPAVCRGFGTLLTYSSGLPWLCWRPPFLFIPLSLSSYSAGIAVGFYGNGETCDGVNRFTYSLRHANRTVSGVDRLVRHWCTLGYVHIVLHIPQKTPRAWQSLWHTQMLYFMICSSWEKSLQSKCVCL